MAKGFNVHYENRADYAYLDLKFDALGFNNTVTGGYASQENSFYNPSTNSSLPTNITVTGFNLYNDAATAIATSNAAARAASLIAITPPWNHLSTKYKYDSLQIADQIDFGDKLSIIAGMNYTHLAALSYVNTVVATNFGTVSSKNTARPRRLAGR